MGDGIAAPVTLPRCDGERVRGAAEGLGMPAVLPHDRTELLTAQRDGSVGKVHSWELVTAVDGPGTRMTLFLSGCPLRCQYCHNPDTMTLNKGTVEPVEDVVKRIKRYKTVFKASGGGLTISGGEPLFQIEFTKHILKEVHDAGIHTCIDTSGFLGARLSDEDLENVDLVLLDVKSGSESVYHEVTSQALQPTIDFGDRLSRLNKPVWVRFVLVPGLTDDPENVANVADIVARWKNNVERVEVLPFHNMGADKWKALHMQYNLADTKPPSEESLQNAVEIFRSRGLHALEG